MARGRANIGDPLDLIPEILRRAGLRPAGCVVQVPEETANLVFFVDDAIMVRIGRGPDGECFPRSAQILEHVAGHVRAPRVLHTDFSRELCSGNIMVCAALPGETLCSAWRQLSRTQRQRVFGDVAVELRKLHQFDPRRFPLCGAYEPWPQVLGDELRRLFIKASQRAPVVPLGALERQAERAWPAMEGSRPAVVHNDVHWNNILVAEGQFSGLLDFDDAIIGPAETDLMSLWHFAAGAEAPELPTVFARPDLLIATAAMVRGIWPEMLFQPGLAQRYALLCIREILLILTEEVPWMTRAEADEEAQIMYEACFISPGLKAWVG